MWTSALTPEQILGDDLGGLSQERRDELTAGTPLWFYILREAGLNGGKLGAVGGRIVAETFHRAIEGSDISMLRDLDPMICPACKSESLMIYATLAPKIELYKSFWHNPWQCKSFQRSGRALGLRQTCSA